MEKSKLWNTPHPHLLAYLKAQISATMGQPTEGCLDHLLVIDSKINGGELKITGHLHMGDGDLIKAGIGKVPALKTTPNNSMNFIGYSPSSQGHWRHVPCRRRLLFRIKVKGRCRFFDHVGLDDVTNTYVRVTINGNSTLVAVHDLTHVFFEST
jgi:hypothetical protein